MAYIESLDGPRIERDAPEEVRASFRARFRPSTTSMHEVRDLDCGGVPGRLYRPSDSSTLGLLVFFHGGGWVLGDLDTHDNVCRTLAAGSGCAVLALDYRLAPEHPFPAALDDAVAALEWAHANAELLGCDPARLAIGGNSGGANLAAVATQLTVVPLRFQLLLFPSTDARCGSASHAEFRDGPWLTAERKQRFLDYYLSGGEGEPDDPRVSPLLAADDLVARAPRTLVITAELDPLRDEGEAYADRLQSLGVAVSCTRYDGMFHDFIMFTDVLDDGRRALADAAAALEAALRP
jgi:acetyl esterase